MTILLGGNHRQDWCTTFPHGWVAVEDFRGEMIRGHPAIKGDVVIGHDVWFGQGMTTPSGGRIADGAAVAANAAVVKDVGPCGVWCVNPAVMFTSASMTV